MNAKAMREWKKEKKNQNTQKNREKKTEIKQKK